jgi:hypothetical protein
MNPENPDDDVVSIPVPEDELEEEEDLEETV